jgi:hypothetical protein
MTLTVIVLTAFFLIFYDIYAVCKGGFDNTISWKIYSLAQQYPIIPFAFGVLMGHFFWSQVC